MAGVPLLCCRGSHRKLERAKWNARVYLGAIDKQQKEEDQDVIQQGSLLTMQDSDASAGTRTPDTTIVKQVRTLYMHTKPITTVGAAHAKHAEVCERFDFMPYSCQFVIPLRLYYLAVLSPSLEKHSISF